MVRWGAALILASAMVGAASFAQNDAAVGDLSAQQKQLDQDRESLRVRIKSLQTQLETRDEARKQAADQLKASEAEISKLIRQIKTLEVDLAKAVDQLKVLTQNVQTQRKVMLQSRERLANQLRSQYSSGLSPWSTLLSGENPQALGRELGYLDYVAQARAQAIETLANDVAKLKELETSQAQRRNQIEANINETDTKKQALVAQRKQRAALLAKIEDDIRLQRAEMGRLGQNEKRLTDLVQNLEIQLKAQREADRLAQEQAKVRAQALAKKQAEAAAKAKQEELNASVGVQTQDAKTVDLTDKDQSIDQERVAQQVKPVAVQARSAQEQEALARQQAVLSALPTGGGIQRGMAYPVKGKVVARFGTHRPEGGDWRGILVAADEGTPVHAVGAGTVVYSTWLRGFGNLIIVDHGNDFLTIYAYNQSLLKQVGDSVKKGEAVALAGNTGGQLDSALYFEIRHKGAPIDPMLYISH